MRPATSPLIVRVPEIPPEGLSHALDLDPAFLEQALEGTEADAQDSRAHADLDLFRTGHEVVARGRLDGDLAVVCSRCAGVARVSVSEPIEIMFVPRGQETPQVDPDADPIDQPDVVPYDGDEIDLGLTLREELLLALPIAPLCQESCRGLCPRCGADLNDGEHSCPEEPKDDRWAPLRNLKV